MKTKQYKAKTLEDLPIVAQHFLKDIGANKIVALVGEMGAGKTTFVKAICELLGVTDSVSSPTFSIANEYTAADGQTIFHFDFYRINEPEEALDFGLDDYLESGALCLMEWPERVAGLLPDDVKQLAIEETELGERLFTLGNYYE